MGTYGDNFTNEFFRRTIYNLDSYNELHEQDPIKYPNNITNMINSLLGLIVFVKEDQQIRTEDTYNKFKEKIIQWNYANEEKNSINLIRHLRNSIAHARITANGSDSSIESLTFRDEYNDNHFEMTLSNSEIKQLIELIKRGVLGV